jgi:hypothetical protein
MNSVFHHWWSKYQHCLEAAALDRKLKARYPRGVDEAGQGGAERPLIRKRRSKRQCLGASASAPAPTGWRYSGFAMQGLLDPPVRKSLLSLLRLHKIGTRRHVAGRLERPLLFERYE